MVDFSQRLKQLRLDKHLTQAQVAGRVGWSSCAWTSTSPRPRWRPGWG